MFLGKPRVENWKGHQSTRGTRQISFYCWPHDQQCLWEGQTHRSCTKEWHHHRVCNCQACAQSGRFRYLPVQDSQAQQGEQGRKCGWLLLVVLSNAEIETNVQAQFPYSLAWERESAVEAPHKRKNCSQVCSLKVNSHSWGLRWTWATCYLCHTSSPAGPPPTTATRSLRPSKGAPAQTTTRAEARLRLVALGLQGVNCGSSGSARFWNLSIICWWHLLIASHNEVTAYRCQWCDTMWHNSPVLWSSHSTEAHLTAATWPFAKALPRDRVFAALAAAKPAAAPTAMAEEVLKPFKPLEVLALCPGAPT